MTLARNPAAVQSKAAAEKPEAPAALLHPSHRLGSIHESYPPATGAGEQRKRARPLGSAISEDSQELSLLPLHVLDGLFKDYGYVTIFLGITLESLGLPLPGESLMIAAAIYAATTHQLSIYILVPLAAAGAICGDQIGYFVGRWIGYRVLARWGRKLGLTDERLELGRFLFRKYGAPVVFFGRFVAILRTFAALLAGANRLPWHIFLLWNALGGIAWTALYGFGAYILGDAAKRISGPMGIVLAVIGVSALVTAFLFIKRNEHRLMDEARGQMKQTQANRAQSV